MDGSISYNIQAKGSVNICGENGVELQNPTLCVEVSHEWSNITITFSAFYQTKNFSVSSSNKQDLPLPVNFTDF